MMKKQLIYICLLLFTSSSWAASSYHCIDENHAPHELKISKDFLHMDGQFMYRDAVSNSVKYDRSELALFNDDDFDLLIPLKRAAHLDVLLIDYQREVFHQLKCDANQ